MLPKVVDVLVLGAGLSGLRAALSCLESAPELTVLVASLANGPSGSSFANQNNALGMHVCLTDQDREAYVREVRALNRGAWLSTRLLAIQAEEGEARLRDLVALGLPFSRDGSGSLLPHASCYSPNSRRAFIFTGLAPAYECFKTRLDALGCSFASGWMPAALLGNPVAGAVLVPTEGGEPVTVSAKSVVVALGGPGRLYAHSMAGPGVPGYGQGLLARAGVRMANQGYLQFMWGTIPGNSFWQPAVLGDGGYRLVRPHGPVLVERLVPDLPALSAPRAGHCPFGYGLDDSALDLALASGLDEDGTVPLVQPDGSKLQLAPMAHASNGGAVIDVCAETNVPGLLACGECATGMHGSNRIGGTMVLATQVFGHRAGTRAAWIAANTGEPRAQYADGFTTDETERRKGLAWLARGLSRYAVLGGRPGHADFAAEVRQRLDCARDWRLSLSLETGLRILKGQPFSE